MPTPRAYHSEAKRTRDDPSLYNGAGGYTVMLLRMHKFMAWQEASKCQLRIPDERWMQIRSYNFLRMAEEQAELCLRAKANEEISFFFAQAAHHLLLIEIGQLANKPEKANFHAQQILNLFESAQEDDAQELLYGQSGYLYSLLYLHKLGFKSEKVEQMANTIVDTGLRQYEAQSKKKFSVKDPEARLFYQFHKKEYIGAAHGLSGILHLLLTSFLRCGPFKDQLSMFALVSKSVSFLISRQQPNGNWGSSSKIGSTADLVQFCHGAPGMAIMLCSFLDCCLTFGVD